MRRQRTIPILIAVTLVAAGCNSNDAADTTAVEAGTTTTTMVETTTPSESTESTVEAEDAVVDDPSVLNGSYQLEWDSDELWEAMGDPPTEEVNAESGVVVLTFENGRLEIAWQTGPSAGQRGTVTYTVSGERITIVFPDDLGGDVVDATWELTDSQLSLSDFTISSGDPFLAVFLGTKPLTRQEG